MLLGMQNSTNIIEYSFVSSRRLSIELNMIQQFCFWVYAQKN